MFFAESQIVQKQMDYKIVNTLMIRWLKLPTKKTYTIEIFPKKFNINNNIWKITSIIRKV